MIVRGSLALVEIDDTWTFAELVPSSDRAQWLLKKQAGAGHDPRILRGQRLDGVRFVSFGAALSQYRQVEMKGWPFRGTRATM
eukprot:11243327-Alexandrium_andersonii.AAC.1